MSHFWTTILFVGGVCFLALAVARLCGVPSSWHLMGWSLMVGVNSYTALVNGRDIWKEKP